jgi:hypothetical protein
MYQLAVFADIMVPLYAGTCSRVRLVFADDLKPVNRQATKARTIVVQRPGTLW